MLKFWLSVICITALCLNLVQIVFGTTATDCYNSYLNSDSIAPEPRANFYYVYLCNFYHDKTGQWFTEDDWNTPEYSNMINKYYQEFYAGYQTLLNMVE